MAAEGLQAVLAGARCGLVGSSRQAGPGLPSSLCGCEEQAQQGSLLGGWPEVQVRCAAWGPRLYVCAPTGRGRRQNSAGQRIS